MTAVAASDDLGTLYLGARRLRQAAAWNERDRTFKEEGGVIVPIVDADVIKLFLDPAGTANRVYPFHSSRRSQPLRPDPVLTTFAAITSEFLFLSQDVAIGGDKSRLWRTAPRLAPSHAVEVASMLREVVRKGRQGPTRPPIDQAAAVIDEYAAKLRDLSSYDRRTQLEIVRSVPTALANLFSGAMLEAHRWLRLTKAKQVLPLSELEFCDITPWFEAILPRKEDRARSRLQSYSEADRLRHEESVEVRAEHDAIVLAQTIALNRRLRARSPPYRAVLITDDDVVHDVYQAKFWSIADQDLDDYVLRRPWQYVPILNCSDIPNGYKLMDLFSRLKDTLDTALGRIEMGDMRSLYSLEHEPRKELEEINRSEWQTVTASRLLDLWREATDTSTALCNGLAVRDYEVLLNRLSKVASDEAKVTALARLEQEIFDDIAGVQLPLVIQELISISSRHRGRGRQAPGLATHRSPSLLNEDFSDIIGLRSVEEFIDQRHDKHRMERLTGKLNGLLAEERQYRVLFFAGAIACAANHFESAGRFLQKAHEVLAQQRDTKASKGEFDYLRAVVNCMRLRGKGDFDAALSLLDRIAAECREYDFEWTRAVAERASLSLNAWFFSRQSVHRSIGWTEPARDNLLQTAGRDLLSARGAFARDKFRRDVPEKIREELQRQIYTNRLCLSVIQTGFFAGELRPPSNDLREILGEVQSFRERAADHIVELWVRVAECILSDTGGRRELWESIARFCDERVKEMMKQPSESMASTDLPAFRDIRTQALRFAT